MSDRVELSLYFAVGLFFTLSIPSLFPSIKVFYLIPFLIRSFYLKPLSSCLLLAFFVGLIIDLLSAHSRLGLYSANLVFSTYFLYGLKRNFFEDSFTTIPVLTFFFSVLSSVLQSVLLLLFERQIVPFNIEFFALDFLLMPFLDAVFATVVFAIPSILLKKPVRKGSDYFLRNE